MCHCAPVLSIHSTASSTQRVGIGLRPGRPSAIFSSEKMIPDALPLLVPEPNHSTLLSDRQQSAILR
jgi:hypothetical protein